MKHRRIRFSEAAIADIIEQSDWYRDRSGDALAQRWNREVDSTVRRILRNPQSGSPCSFASDELKGLRHARIENFPKHAVFYLFRDDQISVLRVLHGARDLENLF
jgi:toxin ParE1/3/4